MSLRLFQIVLLMLVAIFSVLGIAILLSGILTLVGSAGTPGITAVAGGISVTVIRLIVAAVIFTLLVIFAFWRWRIFRK